MFLKDLKESQTLTRQDKISSPNEIKHFYIFHCIFIRKISID